MTDQWLLTMLSIAWLQSCIHVHVEARKHRRTQTTIEEVLSAVRLPRNTDRLVYRYQNDSHIFVGFDNVKRRKVFTMLWKLKPTNAEVLEKAQTKTYHGRETSELRKSIKSCNILAATNSRHQRDFVKNVKDCHQSVFTMNCLIEAFAGSARKMKSVDNTC